MSEWQLHPNDGPGAWAMYYGKSFGGGSMGGAGGSKRAGEIARIPPDWLDLAKDISKISRSPVNYIQCHRFARNVPVKPHFDPGGMIVSMLTLGQERTFRVGGTMPKNYYPGARNFVPQQRRDVSKHIPLESYVMKHGDLLVFTGGVTIHSMFPADDDVDFKANGFDWRISIIFRYTTDAMREYGPGRKANDAGTKEQYEHAVNQWREENNE